MGVLGVNGACTYRYADRTQSTATSGAGFAEQLQKAAEAADTSRVEEYRKYLEQRYGTVTVQDVGKDQRSMDALGASTSGYNNVVIAPNILESMANDPEKAAYYENKIQVGLDNFPKVQAQLSAAGFEIYSYGVVIHSDGTVYTYSCGDLKPEVRAKIEARVKAEQEEKRNRREKYQELSEEAAEKRRLEMETMSSVTAAYKMNAMTVSDVLR